MYKDEWKDIISSLEVTEFDYLKKLVIYVSFYLYMQNRTLTKYLWKVMWSF